MNNLNARVADEVPVQEMVVIHRIFRRAFPLLADLVRGCEDGQTGRAENIAGYAEFTITALHNHHSAEDECLWPLLLDRARPQAELVHRMERQHHHVAEFISRAQDLLTEWRRTPTATSGNELAETLTRLSDSLAEHLDDEEAHILPLVSEHIAAPEWRAMGDRSFAKFSNGEKLIALGQLLDVTTPAEAALFLGTLPLPVRLIWRLAGRRRYARYIRRVRG